MKIGIVNDSAFALEAIRRVVESDHRHSVLWTARDGREAVEKCQVFPPDIVLMDMLMPNLDGVAATRAIMKEHPCPILIVTASVQTNCALVFEAMGAGAVDAVATPSFDDPKSRDALLSKILLVEKVAGHHEIAPAKRSAGIRSQGGVLIGSSAGGPAALAEILRALPQDFPWGIAIVQHVDVRFIGELAKWLDSQSRLSVGLAEEADVLAPGRVLLAATLDHMIIRPDGLLGYNPNPSEANYKPSIDRLFESAVRTRRPNLVGVLLTGMGSDGALGLKAMREAGNLTIAQDEASSALYGMPKAAAKIGAAAEILALDKIPSRLVQLAAIRP